MGSNEPVEQAEVKAKVPRGVVNWAVKGLVAKLFVAAILFISAGRLDWTMGWVYVGVFVAFDVAIVMRANIKFALIVLCCSMHRERVLYPRAVPIPTNAR